MPDVFLRGPCLFPKNFFLHFLCQLGKNQCIPAFAQAHDLFLRHGPIQPHADPVLLVHVIPRQDIRVLSLQEVSLLRCDFHRQHRMVLVFRGTVVCRSQQCGEHFAAHHIAIPAPLGFIIPHCAGICQQQGIQFRVTLKCHRVFPLCKNSIAYSAPLSHRI